MDRQEITDLIEFIRRVDPEHPRTGSDHVDSWQLLLEPVDHDTAREAVLSHYRHDRSLLHPSDIYEYWEQRRTTAEPAPRTPSSRNPPEPEVPATLNWLMNSAEASTVTHREIRLYPADTGGWEWTVSDHTGQQLARQRTDSNHHGMWSWGVEVGRGRRWKPVEEPESFALSGELDTAANELHERYLARGYRPRVTTSDEPTSPDHR